MTKLKCCLGPVHPVSNTQVATWEQIPYLQGNTFEGVFLACISGEEVTFKNTLFCLSLSNIRTVYISYFSGVCPRGSTNRGLICELYNPYTSAPLLMRLIPMKSEELFEKEIACQPKGCTIRKKNGNKNTEGDKLHLTKTTIKK